MKIKIYNYVIFSSDSNKLVEDCSTIDSNKTSFSLSFQGLDDLPVSVLVKSLALLTNITSLNLGYNRLSTLPINGLVKIFTTLSALPKLTSLNLGDNGFGNLPGEKLTRIFAALPNITSLNLSGNYLDKLPEEAWTQVLEIFPSNLISLDLSFNDLHNCTTLPKSLSLLAKSIKSLNLSGNYFGRLSWPLIDLFAALPSSLTSLDLSYNDLYLLPRQLVQALSRLPAGITSIDWSDNELNLLSDEKLARICAAVGPNVTSINLSKNYFRSRTFFFNFPSNVTSVKFCRNSPSLVLPEMLIRFCRAFPPTVTLLDLSKNKLKRWEQHQLSQLFQTIISLKKTIGLSLTEATAINAKYSNFFVENCLCSDVIRLKDKADNYINPLLNRANANIYRALGIRTRIDRLLNMTTLFAAQRLSEDELIAAALPEQLNNPILNLTSYSSLPNPGVIIGYLKRQQLRLPEGLKKQALQASLTTVATKKLTLDEFKAEIITIKNTVAVHRDTGLLGFFKATFIRNTQSYNELMTVLKNKPLSELLSNDHCENKVSLHR